MKKITFAALLSVASFVGIHAQNVGIGTDAPTQKLDVNGTMRVRTLSTVNYPNGNKVVTHQTDGTLTHTSALDVLFSTGLYVKGKNTWNNLLVGHSSAKIDFNGRLSLLYLDVAFSFLYEPKVGFTLPPASNILLSKKAESVSLTQVSASVLRLTIKMPNSQAFSYDFTFTYNNNDKVTITKSAGGEWAKGTFVSTPDLDPLL